MSTFPATDFFGELAYGRVLRIVLHTASQSFANRELMETALGVPVKC